MRESTPPKLRSDGLATFKADFANMAGIQQSTERSYSPIFRTRGLQDGDGDEAYAERLAEMALELDQAFDYMKDVGEYLKEKEDIQILEGQEQQARTAIEEHMDLVDELNELMLMENDRADL